MSERTPSEPEAGLQGYLLDVREGAVRAGQDGLVIRGVDVVSHPRESRFEARIAITGADGVGVTIATQSQGQLQVGAYAVFILEVQPQAVEADSHIAIFGEDLRITVAVASDKGTVGEIVQGPKYRQAIGF